jgi:hypothetical protein
MDIFVYDRLENKTERVSVSNEGGEGDFDSDKSTISDDGRFVSFRSEATNLVSGDTNNATDIFVYDRLKDQIARVSVSKTGEQANGPSNYATISGNGLYVTYHSLANNLDENWGFADFGYSDVFVTFNTLAEAGSTIRTELSPGESSSENNLSSKPQPSEIRGRVFQDLDANGILGASEIGLSEWTVFLDTDANGLLGEGELSQITNTYGEFSFGEVPPLETYSIAVVAQEFWAQTVPRLADGGVHSFTIGAGELRGDVDFGFEYRGPTGQNLDEITGLYFHDVNFNGMQDEGESGLAGKTVYIDANNNGIHDEGEITAITQEDNSGTPDVDETGTYSLIGLSANVAYNIRATEEQDWTQTTPYSNTMSAQEVPINAFKSTQDVVTGDFDEDGDIDAAIAFDNYVSIIRNDGGVFTAMPKMSTGEDQHLARALAVGSLNDDEHLDLVVTNSSTSTISVFFGAGNGTFSVAVSHLIDVRPSGIAIDDFNDDEYMDIAVSSEGELANENYMDPSKPGTVTILYNDGNGAFPIKQSWTTGLSPYSVESVQLTDDNHDGEVDKDDVADLVVANFGDFGVGGDITILYNNGQGEFPTNNTLPARTSPASVTSADLDNDGDTDLAIANFGSHNVSILENIGNGSFVDMPTSFPAGTGPYDVTAEDIDQDGDLDLLVANGDEGHLAVLRNISTDDSIRFGAPEAIGAGSFENSISSSVATADFNQDGVLDVAIANGIERSVSIMLNTVSPGGYKVTLGSATPASKLMFGAISSDDLGKIYLQGTSGDDTVRIWPGTPGDEEHRIDINGESTYYDAAIYDAIDVDGLGGTDTLSVYGKETSEVADFDNDSVHVYENAVYDLNADDFESVYVYSGGGNDTAQMLGSTGNDNFYVNHTYTYLRGDSNAFLNYAKNFASVSSDVSGGAGLDRAYMYDSTGDEILIAGQIQATLDYDSTISSGVDVTAVGFDETSVYAVNGGNDVATLYGSDGNDRFTSRDVYGRMRGNDGGYIHYAEGFDVVTGDVSGTAGTDVAVLFDGPGNDRIETGESVTKLDFDAEPESNDFNLIADGFDQAYAYAIRGGNDAALMTGSNSDDRFTSKQTYSTLKRRDGEYFNYVAGWNQVTADVSLGGGADLAFLYDDVTDDAFTAGPTQATFDYDTALTPGIDTTAIGFGEVYAYADYGGNDSAILNGSATAGKFYGLPPYSYLRANDNSYYNYARGFDAVTANSVGPGDLAFLYGSNGNDVLIGNAMSAVFTTIPTDASQTINTATAFDQVYTYASGGGTDQAYLYGAASADSFTGDADWGILRSIGSNEYFNYVRYFDEVFADPGDDELDNDTLDDRGVSYALDSDPSNGNVW